MVAALADVVSKHRDVDVFGEAVDEPESLGQGGFRP